MTFYKNILITIILISSALCYNSLAQANDIYNLNLKKISDKELNDIYKNFSYLRKRKKISLEELDNLLRFLMASNKYQSVESYLSGNTLTILAPAKKVIENIEFYYNKELPTSLLEKITTPYLGQYFNRTQFIKMAELIKKKYFDNGFFNSIIEVEFEEKENNKLLTFFKINENNECKITKIIISTKNLRLQKDLLPIIRKYRKKRLSKKNISKLKNDMNNYLVKQKYLRAKLTKKNTLFNKEKTKSQLEFTIESPHQYNFIITGNDPKHFTTQTIQRYLSESSINKSTQSPTAYAKNYIKEKYLEQGFANIDISTKESSPKNTFSKNIAINIQEGKKIKIKKVLLSGDFSKEKKYYTKFIKSHSTDLIKSNYFYSKDFELGKKNLLIELHNQGFLKAKVTSYSTSLSEDQNSITINLGLNEGPLTQINKISFHGNKTLTNNQLLEITKLKNNTPLIFKTVEDSIQKVINSYQERGHLEAKINNTQEGFITYSPDNTLADITYSIHEGPAIKVADIKIVGNKITKDHIIKKKLTFTIGDTLNKEKIERSRFELQKMGIFSRVDISTVEKNTSQAKRTVQITISERNPGVFQLGAGLTNERTLTLRGYLGIGYNNILGSARSASLRLEAQNNIADIEYLENKAVASYVEPFLFDKNLLGRLSLSFSQDIFEIADDLAQVSILENAELNINLEKTFSQHTLFLWKFYGLSQQRTFEKDGKDTETKNVIAKIGPSVEFDFRDNTFFPRTGSFSRLSLEYSAPSLGSSETVHFVKAVARATAYIPVFKKITWANSIRGGYTKNLSNLSNSGVPAVEAFFLGSRSTVRGFEAIRERFPDNDDLGVTSIDDFVISGESHFALFKSELRIPLFGAIGATLFYDSGLVDVSGIKFADSYRDSIGVGIQFITPVGPVNFELGYKLDRNQAKNETPLQFHFSIGSF